MARKIVQERFVVRVDHGLPTEKTLDTPLPFDRACRVAARAVSRHGLHDTAEVMEPGDALPVASYIRMDNLFEVLE